MSALYVVMVEKSTGEWREFSRYVDPQEADAVAARLRALGANAKADIVPAQDTAAEGER